MPPDDASALPHHHAGRSNWQDDRDLIEDVVATIDRSGSAYDRYKPGVCSFREWVHQFRKKGYDKAPEAIHIGAWLRELLAEKGKREGSYDLNTRPLFIPDDLNDVIRRRQHEKEEVVAKETDLPPVFREVLATDKTRSFARKRADSLHNGNLAPYLSSLVEKERKAMQSPSWNTIDLLDACRLLLTRRNLKISENYIVNETDFWVPKLKLGVETVVEWDIDIEIRIVRILGDTKFRLQPRHFAIVAHDSVPDHQFKDIKDIETRKLFNNLRVLRVKEFGGYLDGILAKKN